MAIVTTDKLDRAYEAYKNGKLSRRRFLKYLGLAGASLGLVGAPFAGAVRQAWAAKSIRFDGWGGSVSEAFRENAFKPFTKATGIEVIDGEFGDMNSYLTRVKASYPPGGEFNIAHLSAVYDYARYAELGFNSVIDESKIPNLKNVMPAMIKPLRDITKGTLSAVPYDLGQTGIAYNTKYISKEKAEKLGVALLWDKSLKGKLGSWSGDFRTNMWYAALHTGQSPNNMTDLKAVWAALREQRGLLKKYWASGAELMSLLANEEIYATVAWSGRVAALQQEGHPIGYLSPKGTYSWMEYLYVLKGTDMEVAQKLLNFMLEPAAAIAVAEGQNYPPSLDPTKVKLTDKIKKMPAFDPTGKLDGYLFAVPSYWNKSQVEWTEKWDRVMAGS
ncbi:extracellular solute-binding protein [uncultured Desulfosarcina sp.]|uniref:extracellular solute-binding protein n=1 Tax=uncultured Desulfosarcina sp. TaxID=218289 RepID=UPI0029C864BF|nr:extracellular solute-binding protein [uncultured Desulfosarcina sp.]